MLCPACESVRVPNIRKSVATATQLSASRKTQTVTKKRTATSEGADAGKNMTCYRKQE